MSAEPVLLTACGMHTSLGGSVDAAAAFRCGLSRARELDEWPVFDEDTLHEHRVVGHPAAGVMDGFQAAARLAKLANYAIDDFNANVGPRSFGSVRVGFHLSVGTDFAPVGDDEDAAQRAARVIRGLWLGGTSCMSGLDATVFPGNSFGATSALRHAWQAIQHGSLDACIVGAIDSNLLAAKLSNGLANRKVKTVDQPVGFSPGEAAVFLLLERTETMRDREESACRLEALSVQPSPVQTAAPTNEGALLPMPDGTALKQAIDSAFQGVAEDRVSTGKIFADLNGETRRSIELANALLRSAAGQRLRLWEVEVPATSFGDTAGAAALHSVALAFRDVTASGGRGARLVTISGETGASGAVLLTER